MSEDKDEVFDHLIDVCADAKEFYELAAEQAKDPYIESVFKNMAYIRSNIIVDLSRFVEAGGGKAKDKKPDAKQSAGYHGELLEQLTLGSDAEWVVRLEEAEDRALAAFHGALAKNIPLQAKAVLSQQMGTLNETHAYMKALKDRVTD